MSQQVELETVACPLGHRATPSLLLKGKDLLHGVSGEFSVVRCPECGMMWTNPRPTPNGMAMYYPEDYAPYNTEAQGAVHPAPGWRGWLGLQNSNRTPDVAPGKLFEIGCSSGRYLLKMKEEGWKVMGLEFSPQAAERARAKGLDVMVGNAESLAAGNDRYDIVAAWMVIEHLHDPVAVLKVLRGKIEDDGFLIFSVPDAGALELKIFGRNWYALQVPTHLYHYTPETLRLLLGQCGWRIERIFWHPNPANLFMSLHYVLGEKGLLFLSELARKMAKENKWPKLRFALGVVLGFLRQSGRITVWARPA